MEIKRNVYDDGVTIHLTHDETRDLAVDDYSYVLSDIRDRLGEMGFVTKTYSFEGEVVVRLSFAGTVEASDEDGVTDAVHEMFGDGDLNIDGDLSVGYRDDEGEVNEFMDARVEDVEVLNVDEEY